MRDVFAIALTLLASALAMTDLPPLKLTPRTDAQIAALNSTEPELLYSGRKAGGKSWVIVVKGWAYAERYPGARVLWARAERRSMDNTTLEVAREVFPPEVWAACWKPAKSRLELPNGSHIDVLGLDDPGRMQGSRYGFVGIDQGEQLSFQQFEMANACAGQRDMPWHQTMLAVNPETPAHWAYRRYTPDQGSGVREVTVKKIAARVVRVARADLWDLMPASYMARLDGLSGVRRRQLLEGEWCAHEGMVYGSSWDAARMAGIEPPEICQRWGNLPPPDWDRIRGVDFGFDHPNVCLWLAQEPGSDRLHLYRQHYRSGLSPRENARRLVIAEEEELRQLRKHCPDPEIARQMGPQLAELNVVESWADTDRGERATYAEEGIWTQPADKDVLAGIGTVADLMARGKIVTWRGNLLERDERLAGLEEPTCLEEEIPLYHRPGGAEDGGLAKKEMPIKERDHACDALRYVCQSRAGMQRVAVYA
jgi:terminase large subunit-like protein